MHNKPLVGISSCLLGEAVRYDGGSKLDHYLHDVLGKYVEYVPVCPEVESGMGVPREAMRLVNSGNGIKLVTRTSGKDLTNKMESWAKIRLVYLSGVCLSGYIFKSRSPSCGLGRVRVYNPYGSQGKQGAGIFARAFRERFPLLPMEEEGRLNDHRLRENFIERIFVMHRWHELNSGRRTLKKLFEFHARHKYLLMAHCTDTMNRLGRYIACCNKQPVHDVYTEYFRNFITAFGKIATVRKNTNVLQHIMGYFRNNLTGDEKQELAGLIENYHREIVPLIVPVTLLNHYVRKYDSPYLAAQHYLNPHPLELMLRNHV